VGSRKTGNAAVIVLDPPSSRVARLFEMMRDSGNGGYQPTEEEEALLDEYVAARAAQIRQQAPMRLNEGDYIEPKHHPRCPGCGAPLVVTPCVACEAKHETERRKAMRRQPDGILR
jgi:hypothetical protein